MRLRQTLLTLSVAALPFAQRAEAEGAARPNILRAAVPDLFDDPLFESVFKAALDRYAERDYGGAEKEASRIASEARASAKERAQGLVLMAMCTANRRHDLAQADALLRQALELLSGQPQAQPGIAVTALFLRAEVGGHPPEESLALLGEAVRLRPAAKINEYASNLASKILGRARQDERLPTVLEPWVRRHRGLPVASRSLQVLFAFYHNRRSATAAMDALSQLRREYGKDPNATRLIESHQGRGQKERWDRLLGDSTATGTAAGFSGYWAVGARLTCYRYLAESARARYAQDPGKFGTVLQRYELQGIAPGKLAVLTSSTSLGGHVSVRMGSKPAGGSTGTHVVLNLKLCREDGVWRVEALEQMPSRKQ